MKNARRFKLPATAALALIVVIVTSAQAAEARIDPPGGPKTDDFKAALRVAAHVAAEHARRLQGYPDTYLQPPRLAVYQRVVDYRHPVSPAWLFVHHLGEFGPRAHSTISQVTIVSSRDHRVILALPHRISADDEEAFDDQTCDDAVMFKIDAGRFGLALRIDAGPRLGTDIVILGLSSNKPPEILLNYPEDEGMNRTWHVASVLYFVHENRSSPTAIAVRQQKKSETADVIERQTLLYRFDPETDRYVAVQIPQPRLDKVLSAAERSQKTLKIVQTGDMAVENTKGYRE